MASHDRASLVLLMLLFSQGSLPFISLSSFSMLTHLNVSHNDIERVRPLRFVLFLDMLCSSVQRSCCCLPSPPPSPHSLSLHRSMYVLLRDNLCLASTVPRTIHCVPDHWVFRASECTWRTVCCLPGDPGCFLCVSQLVVCKKTTCLSHIHVLSTCWLGVWRRLARSCPHLRALDLSWNLIYDFEEILGLWRLPDLQELNFEGNPLSDMGRSTVLSKLFFQPPNRRDGLLIVQNPKLDKVMDYFVLRRRDTQERLMRGVGKSSHPKGSIEEDR